MPSVKTTKPASSSQEQEFDLFGEPVGDAGKVEKAAKPSEPSVTKEKSPPKAAEKAVSKPVPADKSPKAVSNQMDSSQYPRVPEKRYFTISEAGRLCRVKPHVLRYWESEFKQLSPVKRAGNRRYYQRQDIFLIREIRELLHEQGFTISGARLKLSGENTKEEVTKNKQILREVRNELEDILRSLKAP